MGAWPVGWRQKTSVELVENFFLQYMAAPIVMAFYLAHRIWFRTSPVRTRDMDIDTGRRDFNLPILVSRKLPVLLDATAVLSPSDWLSGDVLSPVTCFSA